jgi:ABC-2 type transport system ATP-binding protein
MDSVRAIEVVDVWRRFGEKEALRGVRFGVAYGEVHALIGPNGAGKSTLLRILAGLVTPTSGTVSIAGLDASDPRVLHRIGLVPAGTRSFYLRLSGLENLIFFARLHGFSKRAARERALEVLDEVGLADAARKPVGLYSGGMQRRLAVARALFTRPPVLLIDEATHDLDPQGADAVRGLTTDIARGGAAVLWATQRLEELDGFATEVTLIHEGSQRFTGTIPDLLLHSGGRRYHVRIESDGELSFASALRVAGGSGVEIVRNGVPNEYVIALDESQSLARLLASLAQLNVIAVGCREERSAMEQAFVSLVTEAPA